VIIKSLPVNCSNALSYVNPTLAATPFAVPSETKTAYWVGLEIETLVPDDPAVPEDPDDPDEPDDPEEPAVPEVPDCPDDPEVPEDPLVPD
jgi:hypothetical protein